MPPTHPATHPAPFSGGVDAVTRTHEHHLTVAVTHPLTIAHLIALVALWPLAHHPGPPYTRARNLTRHELGHWIADTIRTHGSDPATHTHGISARYATTAEQGQLMEWATRQLETHYPGITHPPGTTALPAVY